MATRIFAKNNYICVDIPGDDDNLNDFKSRTFINPIDVLAGKYLIESEKIGRREVLLSDLTNEAGTPYDLASWTEFYTSNTGFDAATGGSVANGGFMDYNDTTGAINLTADTWTDIPNNGAGSFTNKTYKPDGVSELMDNSTGYIDPTDLNLGVSILIRNDYQVNPNTNNALLEFRYQLGNGGGVYTLEKIVGRLDSGSGQNYRFSLEPDLIYMGDTNTRNNPIKIQVKLSTNGTLTNAGSVIQLIKR